MLPFIGLAIGVGFVVASMDKILNPKKEQTKTEKVAEEKTPSVSDLVPPLVHPIESAEPPKEEKKKVTIKKKEKEE